MIAIVMLAAWVAAPPVASAAEPEGWVMDRLDLDVTVAPQIPALQVRGHMVVRCSGAPSPGPTLVLESPHGVMRFSEVSARGVRAALLADAADAERQLARLTLPRPVDGGETLDVDFVLENTGQSMQLVTTASAFYASWAQPWYPVVQGARSSAAAPGSTTLHLPAGWRSVSNGVLSQSPPADGERVERWTTDAPVARSFAAAPFVDERTAVAEGRSVSFHLLKPRATADAQAQALVKAIGVMERRFGRFPYPRFDVVEVPESAQFAASSEQGFILVRSSVLDDESATLPLFAHEAAHGWWGNLVRAADGPGAKMVSEALAQYGAVLAIEELEGPRARDEFLRFSRPGYSPVQCAMGYFYVWREGGDKPLARLEDARWDHTLSDSKGMWVWHMLRGRIGDEAFFAELRSVVQELGGRSFDLDALRARFTQRDPSLVPFFAQWLDRTGAPVLRADWWSIDRGRGVEIHIDQLQNEPAFVVPLEVAVTTASGDIVRQVLTLDRPSQTFTVATPARPLDLRLDPEHKLLLWRPEFGPRP
jgi:hypothetical protein